MPVSTCYCQVAVTENDHKAAALFHTNWNNQSFRNSWLPGLCIREGCAWGNTQGFKYHYFFCLKLYPSFPDSCLPGAPIPAEVPRRLHSQEGALSWGPSARALDTSWLYPGPRGQRFRPLSLECTWDSGLKQKKQCRFKRNLNAGHPVPLCRPHPSPAPGLKPTQVPGIR